MARPPELKAFSDGWTEQHRRIVETLRPLTPEQVQLRAAPNEWAIWQLAANMFGGRLYWLCFILEKRTAEVSRPNFRAGKTPPANPALPMNW